MSLIDKQARDEITHFLGERLPANGTAKLLTFATKGSESNCEYCDETEQLADELATISNGRLVARHQLMEGAGELVDKLRIKRVPATVVTDEKEGYAMKFYGLPSGYEFSALLEDAVDAISGTPKLSDETTQALKRLDHPVHIQVFVTPTCPYCPRAVRMAHQFSLVNPGMIDAEMIESTEFPELAEKYSVMAVPKVVINDKVEFEGALPERVFLHKVMEAAGAS